MTEQPNIFSLTRSGRSLEDVAGQMDAALADMIGESAGKLAATAILGKTGPSQFGLEPQQVRSMILRARELNVIGADMVESNPDYDENGYSAHVAAALFLELLCLLSDNIETRDAAIGATVW